MEKKILGCLRVKNDIWCLYIFIGASNWFSMYKIDVIVLMYYIRIFENIALHLELTVGGPSVKL